MPQHYLSFKRSAKQIDGKWHFMVNLHVPDLCEVERLLVHLLAVSSSLNFQFMTFVYFSFVLSHNLVYDLFNCNGHLSQSCLSFPLVPLYFVSC